MIAALALLVITSSTGAPNDADGVVRPLLGGAGALVGAAATAGVGAALAFWTNAPASTSGLLVVCGPFAGAVAASLGMLVRFHDEPADFTSPVIGLCSGVFSWLPTKVVERGPPPACAPFVEVVPGSRAAMGAAIGGIAGGLVGVASGSIVTSAVPLADTVAIGAAGIGVVVGAAIGGAVGGAW